VDLGIKLELMSVRSWRWTSLPCEMFEMFLVLQLECSSKGQIWALSLCMSLQMHTGYVAPCVFQLFFLLVFCWHWLLHSGAILDKSPNPSIVYSGDHLPAVNMQNQCSKWNKSTLPPTGYASRVVVQLWVWR